MLRTLIRACIFAAALFAVSAVRPAFACSVCIAHALSAALHGVGAQTLAPHQFVAGIAYTAFSKSNGTETPGMTEIEHYHETALDLSYGLTNQLTLRGWLPYVSKRIAETGSPAETASGLGDATVGATYQLPPALGSKVLVAFSLDLKLPTGENHAHEASGALREQHLQVGTGSVDVSPGVTLTWEGKHLGEIGYAGLHYRWNGDNNRGFHYGDALLYNVGWLRPFNLRTATALEFNGRIAGKDRQEDGTLDPDSGGHLGYLSFSLRHDLGKDVGLVATYQLPVWKQLNGTQDEKPLFSISVSKGF